MLSFLRKRYQAYWKIHLLVFMLLALTSGLFSSIPYQSEIFSRVGFTDQVKGAGLQADSIFLSANHVPFGAMESYNPPESLHKLLSETLQDLYRNTRTSTKSENWYLNPRATFPDQPSLTMRVSQTAEELNINLENIYGYKDLYSLIDGVFPSPEVLKDDSLYGLPRVEVALVLESEDISGVLKIEIGDTYVIDSLVEIQEAREVSSTSEYLRMTLERLESTSKKQNQKLEELKLETLDDDGNLLSFLSVVQGLKFSNAEIADYRTIFGRRRGQFLFNLMSQDSDNVFKLAEALDAQSFKPDQLDDSYFGNRDSVRIDVVGIVSQSDFGEMRLNNHNQGNSGPRFLIDPVAAEKLPKQYVLPSRYEYFLSTLYSSDQIERVVDVVDGNFPGEFDEGNDLGSPYQCAIGKEVSKHTQKIVGDSLYITSNVDGTDGIRCVVTGLLEMKDGASVLGFPELTEILNLDDQGNKPVVPVLMREKDFSNVMNNHFSERKGKIFWDVNLDIDSAAYLSPKQVIARIRQLELGLAELYPGANVISGLRQMALESNARSGPAFAPIIMVLISLVTSFLTVTVMVLWNVLRQNVRDIRVMRQRGFGVLRLVRFYSLEFLVFLPITAVFGLILGIAFSLLTILNIDIDDVGQWVVVVKAGLLKSSGLIGVFFTCYCVAIISGVFFLCSKMNITRSSNRSLEGMRNIKIYVGAAVLSGAVAVLLGLLLREAISNINVDGVDFTKDSMLFASPSFILILVAFLGLILSKVTYSGIHLFLNKVRGFTPFHSAFIRLSRDVTHGGLPIFIFALLTGIVSFTLLVSNGLDSYFVRTSENIVGSDVRIKGFRDTSSVEKNSISVQQIDFVANVSPLYVSDANVQEGNSKISNPKLFFEFVSVDPENFKEVLNDKQKSDMLDISKALDQTIPRTNVLTEKHDTLHLISRLSENSPPLVASLVIKNKLTNENYFVEIGKIYGKEWADLSTQIPQNFLDGEYLISGLKVGFLTPIAGIEGSIQIKEMLLGSRDSNLGESSYFQEDYSLWSPLHENNLLKKSNLREVSGQTDYVTYRFVKARKEAVAGLYFSGYENRISVLSSRSFLDSHPDLGNDFTISLDGANLNVKRIGTVAKIPGVADSTRGFIFANMEVVRSHVNSWDTNRVRDFGPNEIVIKLVEGTVYNDEMISNILPTGTTVITKNDVIRTLSPFAELQLKGWKLQGLTAILLSFLLVCVFSLLHELRDFNQNKVTVFVMNALGFKKSSVVFQKFLEGMVNGFLGVSFGVASSILLTLFILPSLIDGLGLPVDVGLVFDSVYESWIDILLISLGLVFFHLFVSVGLTYLKIRNLYTSSFRFDIEA